MLINTKENKNLAKVVQNVTVPNRKPSYNLCVKADGMRFAKMYKESINLYLQAIFMDRTDDKAYFGLAMSYKYLKQYSKAILYLQKLVAFIDNKDDYFLELGVCCLLNGQPDDAVKHLIKAILINKENLEAQVQLAMAHELLDEAELSMMIYDKIITTNPEYLKAYYNKAAMLMGMGNFLDASKTFFQIIKRNPQYYKAYLGIAMSFDKLSKFKDAIRYYKKFLNLKAFSEDADFARTRILELRGDNITENNSLKLV